MIRTFNIKGKAVGKQRARIYVRGSKVRGVTPPKTRTFEAHVKAEYHRQYPRAPLLTGPLCIKITEHRERPQNHYKRKGGAITHWLRKGAPGFCPTRPDLSNIVKSIEDALEGACFKNDSQIARILAESIYKNDRHLEAYIKVEVWELEAHRS